MAGANLHISNQTSGNPLSSVSGLPFKRMKDSVLGKDFTISLVFVAPEAARNLERRFLKKNKVPNVLSFPLSKRMGEVVICPHQARKDAKRYGKSFKNFLGFLFIHALLHLKGLSHGSTMERKERRYCEMYGL